MASVVNFVGIRQTPTTKRLKTDVECREGEDRIPSCILILFLLLYKIVWYGLLLKPRIRCWSCQGGVPHERDAEIYVSQLDDIRILIL